jgi:catechol 2,3-dioxygenase-like lactoylglutathione lyase family enzyme
MAMGYNHREMMMDCSTGGEGEMSGLEVTQIDHVSVLITDVERSRQFYRDLLGLKEIAKPRTFDFVVLWFDLGSQQLHLLLKDRPDTLSPRHFALRVRDAAAARTLLRGHGIRTAETTLIPGADRFFIYDPDGNRIEIIQWLERYDPVVGGAEKLDSGAIPTRPS